VRAKKRTGLGSHPGPGPDQQLQGLFRRYVRRSGFRLFFKNLESHEGTALKDTPANRARVEARAVLISQEIEEGVFDYLRWFPDGNLAPRFRGTSAPQPSRIITLRGFFNRWGLSPGEDGPESKAAAKQTKPVSVK